MVHVVELGASEGYLVKSHSRTRVVEELDASEVFGFVVVLGVQCGSRSGAVCRGTWRS